MRGVDARECSDVAVLDALAREEESAYLVVLDVSKNVHTSAGTLHFLAQSDYVDILVAVASHKNVSVGTLKMLLGSSRGHVRFLAASNPVWGADELRELVPVVADFQVLFGISHNPNVSGDVLVKLLSSACKDAGEVAQLRLFDLSDEDFVSLLEGLGYGGLVGLPRDWALKVAGGGLGD